MKKSTNKTSANVTNVKSSSKPAAASKPDPKEQYKAMLAKALGKKPSEVKPVEVPEDKPEKTIVQPTRYGHNPFANAIKENKNVAEVISAEVKKSKMKPLKDADVVDENRLPDGTEIEIVEVESKKVMPTKKSPAAPARISPKEMAKLQGEKEEIAAAKDTLAKQTKNNALSTFLNKSVKDTSKSKIEASKPASKPSVSKAEHKPFSKMTLAELLEIRGTGIISDTQWIKYAKPLGYSNGGVNVPKSAPKVKAAPAEKEAPAVTPTKTITRKSSFERVTDVHKAKQAVKEVKPEEEAPVAVKYVYNITEAPLADLLAELKRRGCKGSIHVCTEFEL